MRTVRLLVPPTLALTVVTVVHTAASWAHDPPGKHPLGATGSSTASGGGAGGGGGGGAGGEGGASTGTGGAPTANCGGVQMVDGKLVEIGAGCC